MKKLKFCIVFMAMIAIISGCSKMDVNTGSKKTVIATTYAAYDWAKNVIGNTKVINLEYLVDSNVDLHSYQPTAKDIVKYKNADLILSIGGESEEWIKDLNLPEDKICSLMDSVDPLEEELVEGMQGEEEESKEDVADKSATDSSSTDDATYDEHIWLSLNNASSCVDTIAEEFSKLDEKNSDTYVENAEKYEDALSTLDEEYENVVDNSDIDTLLFGDRFPFRYMTEDYVLDYYAAFIGCSAESEASFETIAFLSKKVDELGLKHICVIGKDTKIAESIINNCNNKDIKIVEFNSMQSISNKEADNISYIDIMKDNLKALKEALS